MIVFDYPKNKNVEYQIHLMHYFELYLSIVDIILKQREIETSECNKIDSNSLMEKFTSIYGTWAINEVMIIGYISQYHLWEKQVNELLKNQLLKIGKCVKDFKRDRKSFVIYVREILESQFNAKIPEVLWDTINEIREVTNTWKHGLESKHQKLFAKYPRYYPSATNNSNEEEIRSKFVLRKEDFVRASDALRQFWETLPYKVNYSTSA